VTGIIRFGAMAGGLTAATHCVRYRTESQIAKAEEFFKEPGSVRFENVEVIRHGVLYEPPFRR